MNSQFFLAISHPLEYHREKNTRNCCFAALCRERCPQRSDREAAQFCTAASQKDAENSPIEVEFSDGTLRTAFPTGANIHTNLSYEGGNMLEILKAVLFGIVEGITEWLPVSSTGHLILLDEFIRLDVSEAFYEMFEVVIQLGAILAVILLFFHKLNPFSSKKDDFQKK